VLDQADFLDPNIFWENPYEFAEEYQVMITLHLARGRRVCIGPKDWDRIRTRLVNAYARGGDDELRIVKAKLFKEFTINEYNLNWIMEHKKYTPFIHQAELDARLRAAGFMFVKREDVFDISFERFVQHPIIRRVKPTKEQLTLMKSLIALGFTDTLTLGAAASLELYHRLQDICNGFNPIEHRDTVSDGAGGTKEVRTITYERLEESPKIEGLLDLMEEIGYEEHQIAIFSSRNNLTEHIKEMLEVNDISYAHYFGDNKANAEDQFAAGARVFLTNEQPAAYGLNCLAKCDYIILVCTDYKTEIIYQLLHRILRGQLDHMKFAFMLVTEGSVEERIAQSLETGIDLINGKNERDDFIGGNDGGL
jgi:hypothetical protein